VYAFCIRSACLVRGHHRPKSTGIEFKNTPPGVHLEGVYGVPAPLLVLLSIFSFFPFFPFFYSFYFFPLRELGVTLYTYTPFVLEYCQILGAVVMKCIHKNLSLTHFALLVHWI